MSNGEPPPGPAGEQPPTADSDGDGVNNATEQAIDTSARYQARIALVTAVVALISAILGPLVSLRINADQIKSQGRQFEQETAATSGQAEAEFVRTQQSTAYTDFLTAFNNATLDLVGAVGSFATPGTPPKALAAQEAKAVQAVKDVTAGYYKVRIVAGDAAFDSSQALYGEFAAWSGALLTVGSKVLSGVALSADEQTLLDQGYTNSEYQKLLGLSSAFIGDGRQDFSISEVEQQKKS